ncbi:M20/M25/M40 family metallo-hydrolase [Micromonospora sp. DT48]|uniref:M20/M25/M40 family metallo-hydrolase n=1 Tax=unclassified Micromonospora TaxID=2617518 RepID=UPI0028162E5D|nr:M20/M25/M40 family metallo-hydrolase [Micromonospora sp. CP22]
MTPCWTEPDLDWLREFMAVDSVSPLEGGGLAATRQAQEVFLAGASERGFQVRHFASPDTRSITAEDVPMPVRRALEADPDTFLAAQPSLVVAMGDPAPPERRLVINFHVDTVGPHIAPRLDGDILHGRGAVDDKGPGVAAAVGVAAAFADDPSLARRIEVMLTSVPGEEGGAMGVLGTRWLTRLGYTGRLMLFAEPTGGRVLDACTAAMTPRLRVLGEGSTDDHPTDGHNATVALGFLADHLARTVGPRAAALGAKLCVAGLHTGTAHNRVYGEGELLLNIAYRDQASAQTLAHELEQAVDQARDVFAKTHVDNPFTARLVDDWDRVVRLDWLKRGLPVLDNRDPEMEDLLAAAGFPRHDGLADGSAFTCDAIWAGGPGRYVAVCGPGRLDVNGAHTAAEWVRVDDLATYARQIRDLVVRFGAHVPTQ